MYAAGAASASAALCACSKNVEMPHITAEMGSDDTSRNACATGFGVTLRQTAISTPVEGCTAEITLNEENGVHVADITVAKVAAELSRSAIQALMSFPIIPSTAERPTSLRRFDHHAQDQGTRTAATVSYAWKSNACSPSFLQQAMVDAIERQRRARMERTW